MAAARLRNRRRNYGFGGSAARPKSSAAASSWSAIRRSSPASAGSRSAMRRNSIAAIRMKAIDWATDRRKPLSSAAMQMSPKTVTPELPEAPILSICRVFLPYGIAAPGATSYVNDADALASARGGLQHVDPGSGMRPSTGKGVAMLVFRQLFDPQS